MSRRLQPRVSPIRTRQRPTPHICQLPKEWIPRNRKELHALTHQPQQCLNHHRRTPKHPRHRGDLLPRPLDRQRNHDLRRLIIEQMSRHGVRVAAITAKDKLRKILAHGLKGDAVCFSAEKASECTLAENGIADVEQCLGRPAPSQYSANLSLYVLDAGIKVLQGG